MRQRDRGVVLVFVLVLLALTSTVVVAMVAVSDRAIRRSQGFAEAGAAQALIAAGEASAISALRRDAIERPEIDHGREAWANVAAADARIEDGRFRLEIADAQGLFNLNALSAGGVLAQDRVRSIVAMLDLKPDLAARIIVACSGNVPLDRLTDLIGRAGATSAEVEQLGRLVTVLPEATDVNVNAAPVEVLAILLGNPVQAKLLDIRRRETGFLTPLDVQGAGVILPAGLGFRSDFFRVRVMAQIGETLQSSEALIRRGTDATKTVKAEVVMRQNGMAAEFPPPPPVMN